MKEKLAQLTQQQLDLKGQSSTLRSNQGNYNK